MTRRIRGLFPGLRKGEWRVTSPETNRYNCISWAADPSHHRWWWPDPLYTDYWPQGVRRDPSPEAFEEAFATLGFSPTQDESLEPGVEKVAFFVKPDGLVSHAARQLPNGRWTSKLGPIEDIEHDSLRAVEGQEYGTLGFVMARPRQVP